MVSAGLIVGIDPGLSGAIAVLGPSGDLCDVIDMPTFEIVRNKSKKRDVDTVAFARIIAELSGNASHVVVERVGAMPGQGVTSMFAFGKCYGIIHGVIAADRLPVTEYTPQFWKKKLGVQQGKDAARKRACELWPDRSEWFKRVKDDGRAEAALIAECGRRELFG